MSVPAFFIGAYMRIFLFCLFVLTLYVIFAMMSAGQFVTAAFHQFWLGTPISLLCGVGGIIVFVIMTLAVSLFAFPKREGEP